MSASTKKCRAIPCVVMRGGTSRGVFFHASDLPDDSESRNRILLAAIGASDPRQVDGLGGADLLLSKVALVWPSPRPDADVACSFGSVPPGSRTVKSGVNCGNLAAAVACFVWQEGLAASGDCVRLYNPDSRVTMEARRYWVAPDRLSRFAALAGMPASGELVELSFLDPAGTAGRGLLPTGRVVDRLEMPGGRSIPASIVDAGAQYVFLRADDLGLVPNACSDLLQGNAEMMALVEHLRGQAAVLAGLAGSPDEATRTSPAVPKLAFVAPPADYCAEGRKMPISPMDIDLASRIVSGQSVHRAYAVTGAIATAAAAIVPGSVVQQVVGDAAYVPGHSLRIGHPSGVIECALEWKRQGGDVVIRRANVLRTARRILEGRCYVEDAFPPARAVFTPVQCAD